MRIIIFISLLVFIGCKNTEDLSFSKIEDNLESIESLNKDEALIAEYILEDSKENDYKLITSKDLENMLNNGDDIEIIASIPRGIYILGFIKNAKNFEFNTSYSGIWEEDTKNIKEKFIKFLGDKDKKIIFYDNGENSAITGILWAKKFGYKNVYLLAGNFKSWKENDFEISLDMPKCCQMK